MHALVVTEQGAHVHLEGEVLRLMQGGEVLKRIRLQEVHELVLLGRVEITSAALAALARRGVDVVLLSPQGYFRARLAGPRSPQAALRLEQLRRALDPAFCVRVAGRMVAGKIAHQRSLLLRAQRRLRDEALAEVLGRMRVLGEECLREEDLDRLRGREGQAAALYFGQLGKLVLGGELRFAGRSRRPPRDEINACLSLGYTLLTGVVETELLRRGLDPMIGFFHQPHHGRPSLALDLVEEMRPFVDALTLRLVNRRQLGPVDFERRTGQELAEVLAESPGGEETGEEGVYLGPTGRRIFLRELYGRLRERLHYPPRQGAFELRDILREQVCLLARVVEGSSPEYEAFVPA